jgi:hypothetical protein
MFNIFTISFKEAISKLFERLHFERRCYPVIVLPRVEHFLMIIVLYCNTSVGPCRCSLLLASRGTYSWFSCSFECPVRFRRYLFVILMISSSASGILESLWRVLLLTYHGALNTILSAFDCIRCMICVFEGLAHSHSCIP